VLPDEVVATLWPQALTWSAIAAKQPTAQTREPIDEQSP
jgi:hypothetical protein